MTPRLRDPARLAGSRLLRVQTDDRLVALTRDGNEVAFAAIVDRYRPALERYAERLVGRSRAEDAVQQAFVNAHRAMLRDDREIALKAWLYRITHNAALNLLRGSVDVVELDDATFGPSATSMAANGEIEDVVLLHARLRETLDAIARLPAPQRDAILLREMEGRSHEEIALALGITSGAARQHVMRARSALRAAATAITPYPFISHLTTSPAANDAARTAGEVVAGAGAGAVAVKLTAGFVATGAVVSALALPGTGPGEPVRTAPPAAAQHEDAEPARAGRPGIVQIVPAAATVRAADAAPARPAPARRTSRSGRSEREDREDRDSTDRGVRDEDARDEDRHGGDEEGESTPTSGGDDDREDAPEKVDGDAREAESPEPIEPEPDSSSGSGTDGTPELETDEHD